MRVVAILNQKGGVGKTTTAVNLGAALAESGRRVLLVDSDPQGNLSDHLGIDPSSVEKSIYDVLTDGASIPEAVLPTATTNLFVLPAHVDLAAAEQELATEIARELRLKRAFEGLPVDAYEWVLIDCPPSLGLLSLNAMAAATEIIVTVQTEYFALRGLSQIDQVIDMVRTHVNHDLRMLGVLLTLVNPVTRLAREVIEEIRGHYGSSVFATRIRQNVRLAEAPSHGEHILQYDPDSAGAADYRALAAEIQAQAPALVPVSDQLPSDPRPSDEPQVDEPQVDEPQVDGPQVDGPSAEEPEAETAPAEPEPAERGATTDAAAAEPARPSSNGSPAAIPEPVVANSDAPAPGDAPP